MTFCNVCPFVDTRMVQFLVTAIQAGDWTSHNVDTSPTNCLRDNREADETDGERS